MVRTGTVESYKAKFGHGFLIDDETQKKLFFSYRAEDIRPGTKVNFECITKDRKGLKAEGVVIEQEQNLF